MRISVRVAFAIACLAALGGCSQSTSTTSKFPSLGSWGWGEDQPPPAGAEITGSTSAYAAGPPNLAVKDALLGGDPGDDINLGKRHYREKNFGLAERHFRSAVEKAPRDGEAWLGLAASYDRLKRYELADRAYKEALDIFGPRPEVLNNIGYSLLLRGDLRGARAKFAEAQAHDPENPTIANNIALVDTAAKRRKGLN
jgi:Flp pilus assembly protein TadD